MKTDWEKTYWEIVEIKLAKSKAGICYCEEQKEIEKMMFFPMAKVKCMFCIALDSDYDPDFFIKNLKDPEYP